MKWYVFSVVFLFVCVSSTVADYEPYTQLSLPEGAKARLGKGNIRGNIAYSPDGTRLAVSSSIGVWIYDAQTGEELDLLTGHNFPVWSVAFSPDGKTIASGSGHPYGAWYGSIILSNTDTGKTVDNLSGDFDMGWGVAFSPDGRILAVYGEWSGTSTVYLFDADSREYIQTLTHKSRVNSVAFSPDSKMIAIGSGRWDDGTIHLWDVNTGDPIRTLIGHTSWVNSVAFSPDGKTIASGSSDETIRLWDAETGEHKKTLTGHESLINSIVYSPDGNTLVSGSYDDTVRLWDAETGGHRQTLVGHTDSVSSVAFSPDGKTIASGSENELHLWDTEIGEHKKTIPGHTGAVNSVAISPDGKTLAMNSGYPDKTVRLWDAETGKPKWTLVGHTDGISSVAFSPDGHIIASGSYDNTIRLWSAETGKHIETLIGHEGSVYSIVFSPDGRTLASGSYDETVHLWDVNTGEHIRTLIGHTSSVSSVAFSPDGRTIVSGSYDSTVRLWNVDTGEHIRTFTAAFEIHSVAFSPNGKMIATGSGWSGRFWSSGVLELWDVETGELVSTLFESGDADVHSVAFSPDGKTIAWGVRDGSIGLSDVETGTQLTTFWGHESVLCVTFSADGQTLASSGAEGTVLLWTLTAETAEPPAAASDFDDTLETATVLSLDTHYTEAISPGGDVDYFSIQVDQTGELTIYTTGNLDTMGELQDSSGTSIAENDDNDPYNDTNFRIVYYVVGTGTYYVKIASYESATGAYTVYATLEPRQLASDSGDTLETVTVLSLDTHHTEAIFPGTDVDYFSIQITDIGELTIYTAGNLDTTGELQDSSGTSIVENDDDGDGLNFRIAHDVAPGTYYVKVQSYVSATGAYTIYATLEPRQLDADVNEDGAVNIQDLVLVASRFGETGENAADVNGDGVVNIQDLVLVAGAFGDAAAAPAAHNLSILTPETVQQWLTAAEQREFTDAVSRRGIAVLEHLLATLTPKETALLANYPNPFNPETWIPYQLSKPADVTLTIYAANGQVVRTLVLGHQAAGMYQSRSRAAYWDGRNVHGEPVASGVYFYTLTAGKFTATRKMLIRK